MPRKEAPAVHLRGKTWHARATVRVGSLTERIRETTGFAERDKLKAEAWLRRRISEVETRLLYGPAPEPEPEASSVPGFATAAADYAEKGGRRGPLGKQDIAKLTTLAEFFGETPCDEIDESHWDDFVGAKLVERTVMIVRKGRTIGQRQVPAAGPETERRWFVMFRAPLGRALRKHGIALPEFDVPPAGEGREAVFLDLKREGELLAAYGDRGRVIAEMLAYQGCRIFEALRLKLPDDVNFTAETLTFRETKNGRPRTVPMHPRVAASLKKYLDGREVGPVFLTASGVAYNDRRAAARGDGLDGSGIRSAHRRACERIGLVGFRVHDWRHHAATWFMIRGGSETELMRLFGWKDRRMILRYVNLPLDHLRKTLGNGTTRAQRKRGVA